MNRKPLPLLVVPPPTAAERRAVRFFAALAAAGALPRFAYGSIGPGLGRFHAEPRR